ncbi:DUF1289 domain-containing protein [Arenimonas composti]|uniref:DUF1289 domain-containing protein n=1 Tax=Arenimonas composti TR7-09 = DSM 18010 TaxID=1121013 RepID=A0A091BBX1_9GAMM|nr:DUF1289 domain-containing protein [Arenimonas composti]KFN50163.1 hypothetical protein P873_07960 [Arenimonas composti TR7-09 = DSM 18010]
MTTADEPRSPCVRNCCLDDASVCLGCGRHIDEIVAWHAADADEKRRILARARERREQRRPPNA